MGIGASFALFGAAAAFAAPTPPAQPTCTITHRCHHVLHVDTVTSGNNHAAWDSKEKLPVGPIGIIVTYSPRLPDDQGLQTEPVGNCALHFVLPARFTGFATHCGKGSFPLHVQVANVNRRHLRVGITYWVPTPQFTG
jgi:hypothetical protein